MNQLNGVVGMEVLGKERHGVNKSSLHYNRLKNLDKGKTKSLGFIENLLMKYAGRVDARKGLLRCNTEGIWQSSTLKQEVDSYEEFCAQQLAWLKIEEEENFKKINTLFYKVIPLKIKFVDARENLKVTMVKEVDVIERKEGEENFTEAQVIARRNREKSEQLKALLDDVEKYEKQLLTIVDDIFEKLSHINESFDSMIKITNRILQHCHRRVNVYWRSAMCHMTDIPALPNIVFSNLSEQSFAQHYDNVAERAEKLYEELESELYREGI
ncbi:MAG: hypothetical protein RR370_02840 [Synergistaceae bacterium]